MKKKTVSLLLCLAMSLSVMGMAKAEEKPTELSMLVIWDDPRDGLDAVIEAAEEKFNLDIEYEQFSGDLEGNNITKTRLASGEMSDILLYNSGSIFKALNPTEYFQPLGEDLVAQLDETFAKGVTVDGNVYGVPVGSCSVGAVIYNKAIYEKYGLEIPHTWDDFLANCDVLKDAGETAVLGTYGTDWTSQIPFLGYNYNVIAAVPDFAENFEAGEAKFATTPAGVESFQVLLDLNPYLNSDYLATTYEDGYAMIAEGKAAHWIVLSSVLGNIYTDYGYEGVNNLGIFGVPGENGEDHGITVWEPSAFYVNKNSEHIDEVLEFLEYFISSEGLDLYASKVLPNGPFCVKGYELPDNCYDAVKEISAEYFETGKTQLALEFMTQVKGANCPAICMEIGSGQTTAEEAAAKYDEDCVNQAKQLGLDW